MGLRIYWVYWVCGFSVLVSLVPFFLFITSDEVHIREVSVLLLTIPTNFYSLKNLRNLLKYCSTLNKFLTLRHQSNQLRDPNAIFEDREVQERASAGEEMWAPPGEVVVGGVYLRLFLQNPQWSIRSPKKFLQELLTETLSALAKDATEVSGSGGSFGGLSMVD